MKKVKVLLSAVAVLAVVAGAIASNARNNHVIYTPNKITPNICDVRVPAKAILGTTTLGVQATAVQGAACKTVLTQDVIN